MSGDPPGVFLPTNGVRLHVVQAGPAEGKPVILLHGFPESSCGWRRQIGPLAAAGLRVWAPDQRGYGLSDKPRAVSASSIDELAADAAGLIDAAGCRRAALVGHDWGAAVAWWTALRFPERVERLAILNVPHPVVMRDRLMRSPRQWLRSWYIFFFQIPLLPEALLRGADFWVLKQALVRTSRAGTFGAGEIDEYRRAWSQPGALRSMVNWYRALVRTRPGRLPGIRVKPPALIIWGGRDAFLGREMVEPSLALCEDGRLEVLEEASHWVQHEEPERVNRLLVEFLTGRPGP